MDLISLSSRPFPTSRLSSFAGYHGCVEVEISASSIETPEKRMEHFTPQNIPSPLLLLALPLLPLLLRCLPLSAVDPLSPPPLLPR